MGLESWDRMARLVISPDYMTAELGLAAAERISSERAAALLAAHGVVYGVRAEAIASLDGQVGPLQVEVAKGLLPLEGVSARLEYTFPTTRPELRPQELADGRVDFRSLGLVRSVVQGQVLARRWPPRLPRAGKTVLGHDVQPDFPRDAALMAGPGAEVSEDGQCILAAQSGHPYLLDGVVSVRREFTVMGDVGLSTGHIDFDGDLVVTGSVQQQMSVRATGDIQVRGSVDGARLQAGGDVIVEGGVRRNAVIEAGGDVVVQYLENSTVRAQGSLVLQGDLVQSDAEALDSVLVGGHIVGGHVRMGGQGLARVVGSKFCTPTTVVVAPPPAAGPELASVEQEQAKIQETLMRLTPRVREAQAALIAKSLSATEVAKLRKELELASLLNQRFAALSERKAALVKQSARPRRQPRVDVREVLHFALLWG